MLKAIMSAGFVIVVTGSAAFGQISQGISPMERIDIATQKAGEPTRVPQTEWTVGVWYFAAWEPEYNWDGWKIVSRKCPWRIPILFDSTDKESNYNGISYYRNGKPEVIDWHVRWMRENCINLMMWDWYPTQDKEKFDPTFFGNRALEVGFLGKEKLGGPPVKTNRFEKTMPFAVMWTNHTPFYIPLEETTRYTCRNFFSQPNYYKVDGKPMVVFLSHHHLALQLSKEGEDIHVGAARVPEYLNKVRAIAAEEGYPEIMIVLACVWDKRGAEGMKTMGYDGLIHYNAFDMGGSTKTTLKDGERAYTVQTEDFTTQTLPGFRRLWNDFADVYGKDYFLSMMPMQDFRPTQRETSYYVSGASPEAFRAQLKAAKEVVEARGMRKFAIMEAWNEWFEGSYLEPSVEWGTGWLDVIREEFERKPAMESREAD